MTFEKEDVMNKVKFRYSGRTITVDSSDIDTMNSGCLIGFHSYRGILVGVTPISVARKIDNVMCQSTTGECDILDCTRKGKCILEFNTKCIILYLLNDNGGVNKDATLIVTKKESNYLLVDSL
jgi:hypothetical protein